MVFAGSPAGRDHRSVIIVLAAAVLLGSVLFSPCPAVAGDASAFADLAAEYKKTIRPLLDREKPRRCNASCQHEPGRPRARSIQKQTATG